MNSLREQQQGEGLVDDMDMFELEKAPWLDVQVAAERW